MKQEQILESLSKLNPADDSHWTQDGSPRLGAVGEGVTRQDILAVAPLFNRKNPVLETEDSISEQEIEDEIVRDAIEFEARKKAANDAINSARKAAEDAAKALEKARYEAAVVAAEEKARDTRTDTEINMDLLKSEFQQRLKRAEQRSHIVKLLEQADISTKDLSFITSSPIDRAIAERNIKARRERNKRPVK
jgi:hypothetical protein